MTNFIDPSIHAKISNFVSSQFPQFYLEEGQNFIQFVKAYYEWMESDESDAVIKKARNLLTYRDVDSTLDAYLIHFQNKYLYGIPLYVKGDKRYLIKHILDVYNAKGTIEGYKLLFRLLYNEEIEVYLPKDDILRASDGQWIKQRYLEVTSAPKIKDLEGVLFIGVYSQATAVGENFVRRNINGRLVNILYISNITGDFLLNEPLIPQSLYDVRTTINLKDYPNIAGSVGSISILDGAQNYTLGDVLITSSALGVGAKFNATTVGPKRGVTFYLRDAGSGFTANTTKIISRTGIQPYSGKDAAFTHSIIFGTPQTYSKDLIIGYGNVAINAASYGFSGNTLANVNSAINNAITYVTAQFGQLSEIRTSNGGFDYTSNPKAIVRDLIDSVRLTGNVSFTNSSLEVIGDGTSFDSQFVGNSIIKIVNSYTSPTDDTSYDYRIVTSVTNATHMTLDDYPYKLTSNTYASYKLAVPVWPAQFSESEIYDEQGDIKGQNEFIEGIAGIGNGTVLTASVVASGFSYNTGEFIEIIKANSINQIIIKNGGVGYTNGQSLIFAGGGTTSVAEGYINTYSNGTISSTTITNDGSGYQTTPVVRVQSTGNGAILLAKVGPAVSNIVTAQVYKVPVGYEEGYWLTTRGFLNSNKYIQDSYYYQDYSYSLKTPLDFTKYVDIMKKVFHLAGTEFFGNPYISHETVSIISEGEITINS